MVGYDINWRANAGDSLLTHPIYLKYSNKTIQGLADAQSDILADLQSQKCRQENQEIISYLVWLQRTMTLAQVI